MFNRRSLTLFTVAGVILSAYAQWVPYPTGNITNEDIEQRINYNDNVWFPLRGGDIDSGWQIGGVDKEVGWRLKGDDASAVIYRWIGAEDIVKSIGSPDAQEWQFYTSPQIFTTYNNATHNAKSASGADSTWNSSTIPWLDGPYMPQSLQLNTDRYCGRGDGIFGSSRGANVSFTLAIAYANGTASTLQGPAYNPADGTTSLSLDVAPDVTSINVTASNATWSGWAGTLMYDPKARPWKVKSGAGPNLPIISGTELASVTYCPFVEFNS